MRKSTHSPDPDPDSVTEVPGNGFGADILERGPSEAIQTDLFIGELGLVGERTGLHHFQKPCRVSVLDMMQQHFAGEAEMSALPQGFERFVLRPDLDAVCQPALPDELHQAQTSLLSYLIKLPMDSWW